MLLRFIIMCAMVLAAIAGLPMEIFESYTWLWAYPLLTLGFIALGGAIGFFYLLILCKRVNLDREQEEDDPLYRRVMEMYIESLVPVLRICLRSKGVNKVPTEGRFMLVCNHCSDVDPIMLLHELPNRQIAFISKKENRDMFLVGPMMHKTMCQMIDRENDREALKTILKCIRLLKEDKVSIGVFPEGRISLPDRKLHRFRPGVFKVAQKAQVPIVVCTLKNTKNVLPNMRYWKPTRVDMNVVAVIPVEEVLAANTTELAERIYQMMAEDLGPENVAEEA